MMKHLVSLFLLLLSYSYGLRHTLVRFQGKSALQAIPMEIFSFFMAEEQQTNPYLIELVRTIGQLALPVTVGTFILNGIEKQIAITKESTEKQIVAIKESVSSNRELIITIKESVEKQIASNKEFIEKQIASNKELIIANKESTAESIKASEARIESILLKFTSTLNSRQDRDNRE